MKQSCTDDIFIQYNKTNSKTDIWFFHGFGENGDSFNKCIQSTLQNNYSLYIPDFPGASKRSKWKDRFNKNLDQMAIDFAKLIKQVSLENNIVIIAHSMGSILAVKVANALKNQVISIVSIEGFLIPDNIRFSSKIKEYNTPTKYRNALVNEVKKHSNDSRIMEDYYSRLESWSPSALFTFADYCYDKKNATKISQDFLNLKCPKTYIYGKNSLRNLEKTFLKNNNEISVRSYNCQHWVMNEKPEVYDDIASDLNA